MCGGFCYKIKGFYKILGFLKNFTISLRSSEKSNITYLEKEARKMRKIYFTTFICLTWILLGSQLHAQAERKVLAKELKKEIKTEVKVDNGGTIAGVVKCTTVRYSENVVVYIEKVGDNEYTAPEEHGIIDQWSLVFEPSLLAVQKGTIVDFYHSDPIRHNVYTPNDSCEVFDFGHYGPGALKSITYDKPCMIPLLCNIHAEMSGYIVVLNNPYFSVTGKDGIFNIDNVPPGKYKLSAWHEKQKTVTKDVNVAAGEVTNTDFVLRLR